MMFNIIDRINYQYMAMIAGSFMGVAVGVNVGWSSPYLPYLLSPDSHIETNEEQGFFCAVAPLLGAPFGAWMAALLIDMTGRKMFLLTLAPICFIFYLTMAFASSIWILIVARIGIGAIEGAVYTALPMYYGEIADPKIRGFISASLSVAALFGTIFINIIGPFMDIQMSSFICAALPVLHLITFAKMPESPYYLIKKGDLKGAKDSLMLLRGHKDICTELDEINFAVERQESCEESSWLDLFTSMSNRRALIIYCILCFANKFSGKNPVTFYTTMIFSSADGDVDPILSTVIFNLVGLVVTIVALCVIDRFGRRPMMLCSALGCALALSAEGTYFTLQNYLPEVLPYIGWLPIVALIVYNMIFSFGLSFGPVLFLSELFPTSIKAKALFTADIISVSMATGASKFFQATSDNIGMFVPFWTFAISAVFGALLIYLYVPETKGKTLDDIQMDLLGVPLEERPVNEKNPKV